jgi:nicotinate-nucleotide pyrophosphorylase (carboxylating)
MQTIEPPTDPQEFPLELDACIRAALDEDVGSGDVTTNCIVPEDVQTRGVITAKQGGVIAGLDVAERVFRRLDPNVCVEAAVMEGARVERGHLIARVSGQARTVLTAERTALNFLGRMSGIATLTRQFVDAIAGTNGIILDTRKTAPGLRAFDKLAVRRGGGQNHRLGLYDLALIKENHITCAGSLSEAVNLVRSCNPQTEIEVEVRNLGELKTAIELGVGRILLDNMDLDQMTEAVRINDRRARLEASGNVTLGSVRRIAETGVDFISVGELTHSARVFDVSLILEPIIAV